MVRRVIGTLLVACSARPAGAGDAASMDDAAASPADGAAGDASAPGELRLPLAIPALEPGSEQADCYVWRTPARLAVRRFTLEAGSDSPVHHAVVRRIDDDVAIDGPAAGPFEATVTVTATATDDVTSGCWRAYEGHGPLLFVSGFAYPAEWRLPDDVALVIESGTRIAIQLHAVNATSSRISPASAAIVMAPAPPPASALAIVPAAFDDACCDEPSASACRGSTEPQPRDTIVAAALGERGFADWCRDPDGPCLRGLGPPRALGWDAGWRIPAREPLDYEFRCLGWPTCDPYASLARSCCGRRRCVTWLHVYPAP